MNRKRYNLKFCVIFQNFKIQILNGPTYKTAKAGGKRSKITSQ